MKHFGLLTVALLTGLISFGQQQPGKTLNKQIFEIRNPDYRLSPNTGMTRQHWIDAANYLLKGAFSYVKSIDDPMVFPKQTKITYPHNDSQLLTEKLEGLSRTLFIAAPLLRENPDLAFHGIKVADYYRHQLSLLVTPGSKMFINPRQPNARPSQTLVELGALAISLTIAPEILWDPLPQEVRDNLQKTMISYADGPTVPSNWRFFNIFILSFFKDRGVQVNESLLVEYLQKSLEQYRGEGWYHDSPAFDYYSKWGFQMYGILWAKYYGNRHYPLLANKFTENFGKLIENYPYLFDREGRMIMWGRSISYRFAAAIPLPLMGLKTHHYNDTPINWGWMRHISSGCLLQFLKHPDFLEDNVPTLGFYGVFEPAVQIYSCRGSVYWMGKIFFALLVPADHPFWTAVENRGSWENELKKGQVYNQFLPGSELLITNYPNIGASEVRAWCHETVKNDWQKFRSSENYNRLAYNSAFPWQADGKNGEVAMNYLMKNAKNQWEAWRLYTFVAFTNGIYYRDVVLETNNNIKMNLADIPMPNGILRVDRNISTEAVAMRLGHYALPELGRPITVRTRRVKNYTATIIDNGEYQLAMVPVLGWSNIETVAATGLHPESKNSKVLVVTDDFDPAKKANQVYATLMLWKRSGERWSAKELMPIRKISPSVDGSTVEIHFVDNSTKTVDFSGENQVEFPVKKTEVVEFIEKVNDYYQAANPTPGWAFWDIAAYHTGNIAAYRVTKNERYKQYSMDWAEKNQWKGAKSTNREEWRYTYGETDKYVLFGDWQICFQIYIDLYNMAEVKDERKIARAREVMEYQMSTPRYNYWWWVDGLFMVMPVMTKLYQVTGNQLYLDKLFEYYMYAENVMYDEEAGLFFRDSKYVYPKHKTLNGKKDFWARGVGWVFAGFAKMLTDLPQTDAHRDHYVKRFKEMARALAQSQQPGGYWTRSLLDPMHAPGPETSGTAFFTFGLLWGINNGYLDAKTYLPVALKGWNYLTTFALQPSGRIGYVQPIGERAIPNQIVDKNSTTPFGVGAVLLAASEMYKMAK